MAAYASLATLSKAIEQILPYEQNYLFLCDKHQMQSLLDKVVGFQVFLGDISGKSRSSDGIDELESRIRDVAYRLEDIIESILLQSLALDYENGVNSGLSIQEANSQSFIGEANSELISSIGEANTQLSIQEASPESILVQSSFDQESENEVTSQLSIKEANSESSTGEANTQSPLAAEGRDISRKSLFRGLVKKLFVPWCGCRTVKDGRDSQISDQTSGYESTIHSYSSDESDSEPEASSVDILGWCLDRDFENKFKYSHLPLMERAAAAFGNFVEQVDLLFEEATEMKKILDDKIVITRPSIHFHNFATTSSSRGPPIATDSKVGPVGLDHDLIRILDQVTGRPPMLQVVPITGMGGIGKTTLARAVYDHPKTVSRFDIRLWETVSQEYNIKEILQNLLPGKEKQDNDETVGKLIEQVHKQLVGRRYLVILDDVWDEKVWDGVRNAFPNGNNYSRIVITTRLSKVATYVNSSGTHAHQMQLLNEEQSWNLLRETVYGHKAGCPGEVESIGRTVSRSCKGLPLALVVIGGLLKLNKAKDIWLKVAEAAAGNDDSLLGVMSLSYTNLPPHLKACFLYLASFPEDEEIPTEELVMLWCAEGFLKPRDLKTVEEVAEECLEELVERNLVLVMKKRYDGKIKTSSIHDVLRDLSSIQAQKENFLYRQGHSEIDDDTFVRIIKDQRRVSFSEFIPTCIIPVDSLVRTYRTECGLLPLSTITPHFKLLRVLGKVHWFYSSVRISLALNNKNLRYLHLHLQPENGFIVPESISSLRNLETLIVSGRSSTTDYQFFLPVQIWEMPRLRHLVSGLHTLLPPFPASDLDDSSIECSSLQTLTGLVNFDFTPSVIQKLQNLKKLQIRYMLISRGEPGKEFSLDNLVNFNHLEDLTISRNYDPSSPRVTNIGFPRNLKKLRLEGTELPWEKMALIGDSLEHLQVLKLDWDAFVGKVWEPIDGGFPQLKWLTMKFLDLEEWRAESTHFPSLENLVIWGCRKLKEVPGEIGESDTLLNLFVKKSKFSNRSVAASFEESFRRIQEEQRSAGNDSLQFHILYEDQKLRHVRR